MIEKALASQVGLIIIADPGRSSFATLAEHCEANYGAGTANFYVRKPHPLSGRILKISNRA